MSLESITGAARQNNEKQEASVGGFVNAELSLIGSVPQKFGAAISHEIKEHWSSLAVDATVAVVAGAAIAAVSKNPGLVGRTIGQVIGHENPVALGERVAKFVKPTMAATPWLLGGVAVGNAAVQLGQPGYDLMLHPEHKAQDENVFNANLASVVTSYTASGIGGFAGAKFALGRTAPYVNRGPEVDFSAQESWAAANPDKLDKAARVENPARYRFQEETSIAPDVEAQYNKAFPEEERQAVHGEGGYNEKIAQGANTVWTLRDKETGELAAAHILGIHDQPDPMPKSQGLLSDFGNWLKGKQPDQLQSVHGDFIFVRPELRSQGVGSHMYNLVVDAVQQKAASEGKHLVAVTGEMENPNEPALELMNAIREKHPNVVPADVQSDPIAWGRTVLKDLTGQYPMGIQHEDPVQLGRTFLQGLKEENISEERAQSVGETLQTLDERARRQEFYWALPRTDKPISTPKVDSGVRWWIQDFNDPAYRGDAHWTSVVFDPVKFAPRETGYAFMTDEAGYTLDPKSAQVRQYVRENNYYKASPARAYTSGILFGGVEDLLKNSV